MSGNAELNAHRSIGASEVSLADVLEEESLGPFRIKLVIMCALIGVLDGFDIQAMAFVAPAVGPALGIGKASMGEILTAGMAGLMIGTMLLGPVCDRVGRRPVLLFSVATFGLLSLATATASTGGQLMFWRFATGVGLGGALVSALSLIAEYAPTKRRATLVTVMFAGFPVGGSLGGLASAVAINQLGWQSIFIIGGILPLILVLYLWRNLPESMQFLLLSGERSGEVARLVHAVAPRMALGTVVLPRQEERAANQARVRDLFVAGRAAGTFLLWLLCLFNLMIMYFMIMWLPTILQQSGLPLPQAIYGAVAFNFGGILGGLALSQFVDRKGAAAAMAPAYAATALVIVLLAQSTWLPLTLAFTFVAGAGLIGSQFCLNAVAAAFYPTPIRSTGVGWALGVGRVGAVAAPLLGGWAMAAGWQSKGLFSAVSGPTLACALLVIGLGAALRIGTLNDLPPEAKAR